MARNNLPQKNEGFTGRDSDMAEIAGLLQEGRVVNICGEPGMGKSSLALAAAHRYLEQDSFPGGIVWAGAGDETQDTKIMGLDSLLAVIIRALTGDEAGISDIDNKTGEVHSLLSTLPCLLVLDNMEAVMDDAGIWGFIGSLPEGTKALLTCSEPVSDRNISNYRLDLMPEEDSVRLLKLTLEQGGIDITGEHAKLIPGIAERLGGWPLAIVVTAGQTEDRSLDEIAGELKGDCATGEWSRIESAYAFLPESYRELLMQLSVLSSRPDKVDIFRMFGRSAEPGIEALAARHLIGLEDGRYTMHPLIKELAYGKIAETGGKASAYHKRAYDGFIDKDPILATEHLYLYATEEDDTVSLKEFAGFVRKLINVLDMKGLWDMALHKCRQGLDVSRRLGLKNSEVDFLNHMGMVTFNKGDLAGAMDILDEALALAGEIENRQAQAIVLGNIGNIQTGQGHIQEALESHMRALALSHEAQDRHGVANSLTSIGNLHLAQDDLDDALESFTEALSPLLGTEDKYGLAAAFGNIGGIHHKKGNRKEALENLVKALKIFSDIGDKPGAAYSLFNIGMIFAETGNLEEALLRLRQSLDLYSQLEDQAEVRRLVRMIGRIEEYMRDNPVV